MRRTNPNLDLLEEAAAQLGELLDELVLVGGCAAGLLVTDPGSSPIRPTEDVDLLVEATTYTDYQRFGKRLEERGFMPGTKPGDPICRWRRNDLTLDIMPSTNPSWVSQITGIGPPSEPPTGHAFPRGPSWPISMRLTTWQRS